MSRFNFEIEGVEKLLRKMKKADEKAAEQLAKAMFLEGELIMTKAKRMTPVDTGTLRSSGHVKEPRRAGFRKGRVIVELGFGGAASAYALSVHEHPSRFDPPSWKGKRVNFSPVRAGPKFLEKPVRDASKTWAKRLVRHLDLF